MKLFYATSRVCLSEHVMTSEQDGGYVLVLAVAVWQCVNNLCQKLDRNKVCNRAFTNFLKLHITPIFSLNLLLLYSLNV